MRRIVKHEADGASGHGRAGIEPPLAHPVEHFRPDAPLVAFAPIEISERVGREDLGWRDDRLADLFPSEAPANGVHRQPADDLGK